MQIHTHAFFYVGYGVRWSIARKACQTIGRRRRVKEPNETYMGAEPLPCSILKTRGSVHKSTLRPVAKRIAAATRLAETRQHDALRPTNPFLGWNARSRAQRLRGVADSIETSASFCLPAAAGFSGQVDLVNGAPIADDTNGPTWHGPMVLAAKATRCRHGW